MNYFVCSSYKNQVLLFTALLLKVALPSDPYFMVKKYNLQERSASPPSRTNYSQTICILLMQKEKIQLHHVVVRLADMLAFILGAQKL